jgi:hypothetical protein
MRGFLGGGNPSGKYGSLGSSFKRREDDVVVVFVFSAPAAKVPAKEHESNKRIARHEIQFIIVVIVITCL